MKGEKGGVPYYVQKLTGRAHDIAKLGREIVEIEVRVKTLLREREVKILKLQGLTENKAQEPSE
jgi:hypothetical protein